MIERFRNIRALIFDFDGTLVDASIAICQAFNVALEQFGFEPASEKHIRSMIGRPLREMFPSVIPSLAPAEIEGLIEHYRVAFRPIAPHLSKPMPGLETMLNHFHPGTRLAIATSRMSDGAQQILGAMRILDRFDVIVGLQDVENAKPHPEPVLKALSALNVRPEEAIMVGDVPDDMLAGKSAGTHAIGVASALHPADRLVEAGADTVIRALDELIALVSSYGQGDA